MSSGRRRKRRRRWYRRPLYIVPLVLGVLILATAGIMAYRTISAFDTVHSISTPPPEVSGVAVGGDESLLIDTGPAQEAIRDRQDQSQLPPSASNTSGNQQQASQPGSGNLPPPASATESAGIIPPASTPVSASTGTNILLMGVDASEGQSIDVGLRSESLAVLHLDKESGACRILVVPNESRVELPGYGLSRIDNALAVGGIPYQQQVVEQYLDLRIDQYTLIDYAGLRPLVDAVDGISVDNPEAFGSEGIDFAAGPLLLDGDQALAYSRYEGEPDSDPDTVSRRSQILRALMTKVASTNPVKLVPTMFPLLSSHVRTDYDATDIVSLAGAYRDTCTSTSLETRGIPGDLTNGHDNVAQRDVPIFISDPADIGIRVDWLESVADPSSSGRRVRVQ